MIRELSHSERLSAKHLLENNKLPTDDLNSDTVVLFGYFKQDVLVGCVGIEEYDDALLLRSLAVNKDKAACGIGTMLTESVGRFAYRNNKKPVYLLTDTAEAFFSKLGFIVCNRSNAPSNIQQTKQFSVLCAESAILMKLEF